MTTATELLRMIETVDPSDSAKLDEIDAKVVHYLYAGENHDWDNHEWVWYTRDRNALKAIRPEGNYFCITSKPLGYQCGIYGNSSGLDNVWSAYLPTEELAELHAIIQAIAHDRKQACAA